MRTESTSSSSSSDSPRSSSPFSDHDSCSSASNSELELDLLDPSTYVYLPSLASVSSIVSVEHLAHILSHLFDLHAVGGVLGLVLTSDENFTKKEEMDGVEYSVLKSISTTHKPVTEFEVSKLES